jgi:hypothetical protein
VLENYGKTSKNPFMSEQNRMLEQFLDTSYASQDSVADVKLGAMETACFWSP